MTTERVRKRISRISLIPRDELLTLADSSHSMSGLLRCLGYTTFGAGRELVKARLREEGFDPDVLTNRAVAQNTAFLKTIKSVPIRDFSSIFCKNSPCINIRSAVIKFGVLPYVCLGCGNNGWYNGKPLSLQLDHINAVRNDNRVRNLRWLCPNCHSQTSTFGGRRFKKVLECVSCGSPTRPGSRFGRCRDCCAKSNCRIVWPTPDEVRTMVFREPATKIASRLGVSDVALAKFCRKHGIEKPGRGYWAKNGGE
jgi:hypothetical protein